MTDKKKIKDLTPEEMREKRREYHQRYKEKNPERYLSVLRENSKKWRTNKKEEKQVKKPEEVKKSYSCNCDNSVLLFQENKRLKEELKHIKEYIEQVLI